MNKSNCFFAIMSLNSFSLLFKYFGVIKGYFKKKNENKTDLKWCCLSKAKKRLDISIWNSFRVFVCFCCMSEQKGQFSVIHEGNPKSNRLSKISILLVMWATDRSLSTLSSCSQQELDEHTLMRFSKAGRISISFSTSAKASNNSRPSASTTAFRLNGVFKYAFPERTPEFQKFSFNQRFNVARSWFFFLFLVNKAIKFILV